MRRGYVATVPVQRAVPETDPYEDDFLSDGCVTCPKCQGMGTVPDFENWHDEDCRLCFGEGEVKIERADRYDAIQADLSAVLAKALEDQK